MTRTEQFYRLFKYDSWASLKILAALQANSGYGTEEKAHVLFFHTLASHEIWHHRIRGTVPDDAEFWPEDDLDGAGKRVEQIHQNWRALVKEKHDSLDQIIHYKNSSGTPYDTSLADILLHITIHSQHHRAQIALLLRQADIVPPPTDYIFFTRDNNM